jgi:hypothetical protein
MAQLYISSIDPLSVLSQHACACHPRQGISITTVTDVQLNLKGSVLAMLAIVTTCFAQIWTGIAQKRRVLLRPKSSPISNFTLTNMPLLMCDASQSLIGTD